MTVYQIRRSTAIPCRSAAIRRVEIELGKQLFYGKYSCQGCHIVDTKTDKGYIGPTLSHVGSRLTAVMDLSVDEESAGASGPVQIEPNRAMSAAKTPAPSLRS